MQSAILAWRQSDYATAREHFKASLARLQACGNQISAGSVLSYLGGVAYEQGEYASAQAFYEQALAIWEALPNTPTLSCSLTRLAIAGAITNQGDLMTARKLCEERLPFHRQNGEMYSLSYALNCLANILFMQGDLDAARPCYEESLALRQSLENKRGIAATMNDLGVLHSALGNLRTAQSLYMESLVYYQALGNRRGMASALSGLARVCMLQGDLYQAATLLVVVEASLSKLQASLDDPVRTANQRAMDHIRNQLDPESLAHAVDAGTSLTLDQAIRLALADSVIEAQRM